MALRRGPLVRGAFHAGNGAALMIRGRPFKRGHIQETREQRFWSKVRMAPGDGCFAWLGGQDGRRGYGKFWFSPTQRSMFAHRAAWVLMNGAIPDGLHVLHRCDNPICVRPDHLFLGTPTDNLHDAITKGRHSRRHCVHGHAYEPGNVAINCRGSRMCIICLRESWRRSWRRKKGFL